MPTITPVDLTGVAKVAPAPAPAPVVEEQQQAAPQAEQPQAEQKPQPSEEDKRFMELARKEKMIRMRAKELADKERMLTEKEQKFNEAPKVDDSWKSKLKEDPLALFNEAGVTYEDILNNLVNQDPNNVQLNQLRSYVKQQDEKLAAIQKQLEENQNNSYNQAVKQITNETQQLIKALPDDFEAINASGDTGVQAVVELIKETFDTEGYLMDVEEAAKAVEEYMIEETLKAASLKKVKAKLSPSQVAAQAEVKPEVKPAQAKTLSHAMPASSKPMTAKERRERAILAFHNKLNT